MKILMKSILKENKLGKLTLRAEFPVPKRILTQRNNLSFHIL